MANNPGNNNYDALRDQNRIPVATGQSNADSTQSLPFLCDHVTGRLLVDISGGSSTTFYSETPSGAIDGVNKVYTTAHTINTVLSLIYNGESQHPTEYTVSGAGFTEVTALPAISGAAFTIVYV